MALSDHRIAVSFSDSLSPAPGVAMLVEGDVAIPSGTAAGRFETPLGSPVAHAIGCTCCVPRGGAGAALGGLYRARATGAVPFFDRVEALTVTAAGRQAVLEALARDPVASACFRLA